MSCDVIKISENKDLPVLAGTYRFLAGLLMMFFGLFVGIFSNMPGHGLGLLFFFVSPFVIFTDGENFGE